MQTHKHQLKLTINMKLLHLHILLITLQLNQQCFFFPPQKYSKIFKNIQYYSDLSHASSGAGKQGKCSESCFLIFLQEKEYGK